LSNIQLYLAEQNVYVRVKANKDGYVPSLATSAKTVPARDRVMLKTPTASYNNADGDLMIQVDVTPATGPRFVKETGYMIDAILGNQNFADVLYDEMHHVIFEYDNPYVDGRPDEVNGTVFISVNMQDAQAPDIAHHPVRQVRCIGRILVGWDGDLGQQGPAAGGGEEWIELVQEDQSREAQSLVRVVAPVPQAGPRPTDSECDGAHVVVGKRRASAVEAMDVR